MMSVMRHASKFSSFESEMHHHIYFSSTKERQDRGCPQKDPEGGKALTSNPIFQLDRRWTRELAKQAQRGRARVQVASHHGTYVQGDQLMHASSGISPLPLKTVVKLMWFQVP